MLYVLEFKKVLSRLASSRPSLWGSSLISLPLSRAGEGRGATITDRYVHQSVECQYKSQFLVAEGKCMTWY